jgi:Leucine-rich repeat (LRR) protein
MEDQRIVSDLLLCFIHFAVAEGGGGRLREGPMDLLSSLLLSSSPSSSPQNIHNTRILLAALCPLRPLRKAILDSRSAISLSHLSLSLSSLPFELSCLTYITSLSLSGNKLTEWPSVTWLSLSLLEVLNLSGNLIVNPPQSQDLQGRLSHLKRLDLSSNPLISLPPPLPTLHHLDIRNTRVTSLSPSFILLMPVLFELKVDSENITNLPRSILSLPAPDIRVYFERLGKGSVKCNKLKLMVLGDQNVGKTVRFFLERESEREKET